MGFYTLALLFVRVVDSILSIHYTTQFIKIQVSLAHFCFSFYNDEKKLGETNMNKLIAEIKEFFNNYVCLFFL